MPLAGRICVLDTLEMASAPSTSLGHDIVENSLQGHSGDRSAAERL